MTWYEILIMLLAIAFVAVPVGKKIKEMITFIKTGKTSCSGNCAHCSGCAHAKSKCEKKNSL